MFTAVNNTVPDAADFLRIRQDALPAVNQVGQQGMHSIVMAGKGRFVQKGFPPPYVMLEPGIGQTDAVRLALGQDFACLHLVELIF